MADSGQRIVEGSALTASQKKDLLNRLARVEGQLRGIQKLIVLAEQPSDCDAVAQQMAAARKALDRSFVQLHASAAHLAALLDKFA
jgi:CsoR family transcriptional regulator, copper-sensing transcriptional repressor